MASGLYQHGRERFALGVIKWKTAAASGTTVKVTLVDAAEYTVDMATHEYMNTNTVPAASRVATGAITITSDTPADGVCDGNDVTFTAVSGDQSEALIIWGYNDDYQAGDEDGAATTTCFLIAYLDSAAVTGLPVLPNGGNITVTWDDGSNKIFKL